MENYDTEEIQEVKRTFAIEEGLFEKMEQAAYWDRKSQKVILNEALFQYFEGKEYNPLPSSYNKPKRGRKPA